MLKRKDTQKKIAAILKDIGVEEDVIEVITTLSREEIQDLNN